VRGESVWSLEGRIVSYNDERDGKVSSAIPARLSGACIIATTDLGRPINMAAVQE
jgi:hypothetical protein